MSDVTLSLRPSGPILVSGPITLNDTQGNSYDLGGKETIALCRCGASQNRPFCDGSHKTCGFEGNETVNPA
jgi:CDGSH iron-sulfur domain-containing protein 3